MEDQNEERVNAQDQTRKRRGKSLNTQRERRVDASLKNINLAEKRQIVRNIINAL